MPKTILLIEDDLPTIEVYKMGLEKTDNFKVEAITLGYEAMERIKEIKEGKTKKPDIVLLDLILPDINGIVILEEIKKYKETKEIPVIVLTNYGSLELKRMGYELKAEEYITKVNYTPRQLVKLIKERLKKN